MVNRFWPIGVRVTPRRRRSNRVAEWATSRARTCADRVDWLTPPARPALVKLPAMATEWKARSRVRFIPKSPKVSILSIDNMHNKYLTNDTSRLSVGHQSNRRCRMSSLPFQRAVSETGDPLLLTPGPLTTSKSVKAVMVHDWGSRDAAFLAINNEVLERLPEIVNA